MQSIIDRKTARQLRKSRADLASLRVYLEDCIDAKNHYEIEWNNLFSKLKSFFGTQSKEEKNEKFANNSVSNYVHEREEGSDERKELDPKSDLPDWVKKAFRKIAMKTHPDRVKDEKRAEELLLLFNKASDFIEDKNFSELIQICDQLDIVVDVDPRMELESNIRSIEKTREKIKSIETTIPWIWGESEGNHSFRLDFLIKVLPSLGIKEVDIEQLNNFFNNTKS